MATAVLPNDDFHTNVDHNPLELFCLIWLDMKLNVTDARNTEQKLRSIINRLKKFEDAKQCQQYIEQSSEKDRLVLIVSGQMGQEMVPSIHKLRQVISIYVYCMDKKKNEEWTCKFSKVKGVVVKVDELISRISADHQIQKKVEEPLSINIFTTSSGANKSTIGVNGQFVFSQVLIDCLLRLKSTQTDKTELINCCRNEYEEPVLFEIDADSKIVTTKSFAHISELSDFPDESEALFMLGSIFRLQSIDRNDDQIWKIRMTLCSDNELAIKEVLMHMKQQTGDGETNLRTFGRILREMGKLDLAEKYFNRLLEELLPNDPLLGSVYEDLGKLASQRGDFDMSIQWYQKLLAFKNNNQSTINPIINERNTFTTTMASGITLEFHNGLAFPIQLVVTQNIAAPRQAATIPTGQFVSYDCPQGFAGNFKHTFGGKGVTLFEIAVQTYDSNTYYDLSVIAGFNVPMKVHAPDGTKIQALNAQAPDAFLSPTDDSKTHAFSGDGKFMIVFEY